MTKEEIKEKIAELQAELERIESRRPKDGKRVYLVYDDGSIIRIPYSSNSVDHNAWLRRGLILPTREAAELYDRKRVAIKAIKDYVAENMPFTPDWNDDRQKKWIPYYDYQDRRWYVTACTFMQFDFLLPYVGSEDDCHQLIRDCVEQLNVLLEEI